MVTSGSSTTFQAQQASIATGTIQGTYAQQTVPSSSQYLAYSTTSSGGYLTYSSSGTGSTAPPGWLLSNGALVSAPYGNRFAVTGTPTGFVVIDLQTRTQVLPGTTPSAVRGIATDPKNGVIYATGPDSNSLITLPFPPLQ
jgi:hypothetical protein